MINKLLSYKTYEEMWGEYYEVKHPTQEEYINKINEIIDTVNYLAKHNKIEFTDSSDGYVTECDSFDCDKSKFCPSYKINGDCSGCEKNYMCLFCINRDTCEIHMA